MSQLLCWDTIMLFKYVDTFMVMYGPIVLNDLVHMPVYAFLCAMACRSANQDKGS